MLTRIFFKVFLLIFFVSLNLNAAIKDPVKAENGMVVSASELASKVGADILKKGGNAVDASVAVGFALAVTFPYAGNIGGGGFMVIHLEDGLNTSIDYREKAPAKAHRDMYLDDEKNVISGMSTEGWSSGGVPGSVAGMIYALEKYGTLSLKEVIKPAIELAANGFPLSYRMANDINGFREYFLMYESSKKIFTNKGQPKVEGEMFVQTDLANTLKLIKENGRDGFYKGNVAELIVKQSGELGGFIEIEDLENYEPVEREPITGEYKDYKFISMPPPSSGGIALAQALNIIENFNFEKNEWGSSRYIHTVSEVLKYVYADRSQHLGDEDFYNVPKEWLTSEKYAEEIASKIGDIAVPSKEILPCDIPIYESNETTHYSVVDKFGNAVSVTTTINSGYGSKVVVDGAGFLLNNEMDDFSAKPGVPNQFGLLGNEANSIQPNKRMLSSMSPTIVTKNDKPYIVIGSPGGSRIITTVLQVILNCIDFGMDIQEAIDMPRFHHQWMPDRIDYEKFGMSGDVKKSLENRGQTIGIETVVGRAQGIMVDKNGTLWGASDSRGFGKAIGY
ncbi:MAG: gamma-glutamyltransferase [Melioribacteraceae bacterium]|nr:gamma-glutamyltransferase [Melioribacteraceae bacterium]